MKTKDYIKKFNLDERNWDRKAFIKALGDELKERITITREARKKLGLDYSFNIFMQGVKEIQEKFWSISAHKKGEPFSKELFSAFYASVIIPLRAELFPKEDAEIKERREKRMAQERANAENSPKPEK